jgi:hypothetical protein
MLRPHLSSLVEVWQYLPAAILGCFLPITMALLQGQSSILLLSTVILVGVRLERGQDAWAGFFLGLICTKFQYAVPIALLFLVWRRWRFVGGFAISTAFVTAISLWVTGIAGLMSYAHFTNKHERALFPAEWNALGDPSGIDAEPAGLDLRPEWWCVTDNKSDHIHSINSGIFMGCHQTTVASTSIADCFSG